ncbi:MAG: hypothetical protein JWQ23_1291 [Herminiimonas sp.]|nr:hypothetical protein [Herminiimonas sp.]
MQHRSRSKSRIEHEVESRFGVLPGFIQSAPAPESFIPLWDFAKAAYLDNPLPSLFKERLFVHLSRLAAEPACLNRHVGLLLGHGFPSGDRAAMPQTVDDVLALLRMSAPSPERLESALMLLRSGMPGGAEIPPAGAPLEEAVFQAAASIFLDPVRSQAPREALREALGAARSGLILSLITFIQAAHMSAKLYPEAVSDPDLRKRLDEEPELGELLRSIEQAGQADQTESAAASAVPAANAGVEKRAAFQEKFIDMLGHELRNPVAAISAVSDMFQVVGVADERLRNVSNILHRQTKALTRMLNNLLDVSSLSFGNTTIPKSPVAIEDVVASVVQAWAPRMKEKGLAVTLASSSRRTYVLGDRARLVQLFEHILSNAEKFGREGGAVAVRVDVDQKQKQVRISFADDGRGFEPAYSTLIFQPFSQAPQERERRHGGLGLGLAIAKSIAELHDGSLEASSPGLTRGATFTLSLPVVSNEAAAEPESSPAAGDMPRMRVLAIEDNRDFAQLFRHMLEIMGCDLEITADAQSGLKLAHEILPELIFCDIGLPGGMDGFDFARAVRADDGLAHIPLVAVSGYSSPEDRARALAAGFDRICAKPVKFADINDVLSRFSKHRRSGH